MCITIIGEMVFQVPVKIFFTYIKTASCGIVKATRLLVGDCRPFTIELKNMKNFFHTRICPTEIRIEIVGVAVIC